MALSEYKATINGVPTTLALSEEDAAQIPGAEKVGAVDQVATASETRGDAEPVSMQYDERAAQKSARADTKRARAQQDKSA